MDQSKIGSNAAELDLGREVIVKRPCSKHPGNWSFRYGTDPAHLARWWGPNGFTTPLCEVDATPGGKIRIDMRGPDGTVYPMTGVFREVTPPERLVFTTTPLDPSGKPLFETLNIVNFADQDGKTTVTVQARRHQLDRPGSALPAGHGSRMDSNHRPPRRLRRIRSRPGECEMSARRY